MNEHQALMRIRKILDGPGPRVRYSKHGKERAKQRQISLPDVIRLLRSGFVAEAPAEHAQTQNWTCVIEGADADGQRLRVIVGVDPARPILTIVSVIRLD